MKKIIALVFFVFTFTLSFSQNAEKQHEANFLFGFARLMEWPQYEENQVVVHVLGESVVFDYLNYMSINSEVSGRKLIVRQSNLENAVNCNILFISEGNSYLLPEILGQSANKSVLIVTEKPGLTFQGADVSFSKKINSIGDSSLTYTYNLNTIKEKDIKVAIEFIGYGKN
ncbi:MAG: YfiR family protein [Bacteroidales bacterium]|nr:YfiR family protein [Bacteroidales bacterium]